MPETEQNVGLNPKRFRIPKIFKNRIFIFGISFLLFILGAILLVLLDSENKIRPKWADGIYKWLASMNLTFNVTMATWVMFFVVFAIFFLVFFILIFYKDSLERRNRRSIRKHGEEMKTGERVLFSVLFFTVSFLVIGAAIAGAFIFLNLNGYIQTVVRQMKDFGPQMINFLIALGLLLAIIFKTILIVSNTSVQVFGLTFPFIFNNK